MGRDKARKPSIAGLYEAFRNAVLPQKSSVQFEYFIISPFLSKKEPNKSCLLALRDIILEQDEDITETRKWGMPCFCYKKKMFCYLWTGKKNHELYILLVEGKHLNHPQLEKGNRTRMKILRVNPCEDIDIATIANILQQALDLYRNGIVKLKK
ncbi:DUF1801 domain-containing protein [Tunicatimonas pelagia]|uniref:DUF1801 domain-containing protein n=1 Tax=Tunicatimonas pelagia TaxID=931531 RepID=UPI0026658A02|nr:DUF1801 domain-containing protein [Tunicatimonas pelagia]WKN41037.1 DUF1801 domain-containing protein [Tunicatimonas pelagia]